MPENTVFRVRQHMYNKAMHLFYTNRDSMGHNTEMLNTLDIELKKNKAKIDVPKGSGYNLQVNEWGLIDQTNFSMNL